MYEYFAPANTPIPKLTASLKKHNFLHWEIHWSLTNWLKTTTTIKKNTPVFFTPWHFTEKFWLKILVLITSLVWICGWLWRIWVQFPGLFFPSAVETVLPCAGHLPVQPGKMSESPNISRHFWSNSWEVAWTQEQVLLSWSMGMQCQVLVHGNVVPDGSAAWRVLQHGPIPGQRCRVTPWSGWRNQPSSPGKHLLPPR